MPTSTRSPIDDTAPHRERLQKVLAAGGLGSRRQCEEYILAGRIAVDGQIIQKLGVRVDSQKQKITVDGERIRPERRLYFMLNKPPGCLCTNSDPAGRPRVVDLFRTEHARLFTVGRLDENSQGLLVVTNDGELGNRLAHPRYQISKTYRVQVAGNPTRETLDQLQRGLHFGHGTLRIQSVRRLKSKGKSTFLEIVLNEGQNRVIRRLLARVGHKTIFLERVAFGPLKLGRLPVGKYRALRPAELKSLYEPAERTSTPRRRKKTRVKPIRKNVKRPSSSRKKSKAGRR